MEKNKHPYYTYGAFSRLLAEYLKYDTLYIAFDFDNTIWDYDTYKDNYVYEYNDIDGYRNYGKEYRTNAIHWDIVELLRGCKKIGLKLCLWTSCPKKEDEDSKVEICKQLGIEPDYINCSPLSPGATKPHFSLLLDDRAGLESAVNMLSKLLIIIAIFSKANKDIEN